MNRICRRQFSFGRGGPLAHDSEPTLAGRNQLIAICVQEEQEMQATLTSQPSNEDKTTAACVNRRYREVPEEERGSMLRNLQQISRSLSSGRAAGSLEPAHRVSSIGSPRESSRDELATAPSQQAPATQL